LTETEDVTVAQARKSTLVVAGVLVLVAGWQLYRGRPSASSGLAAAGALLLVCAAIPAAAILFHKWWMTLAGALGYVNSQILLSALFFLVLTPIGLVVRLVGHDPLERKRGNEKSYWRPRAQTRQTHEGYERAF
jgi:hypothetical protein